MNYFTYIQVTKEYLDSLKGLPFFSGIQSIYLVRGFAKADLRIGQSDIDIVILLHDTVRSHFREIVDEIVTHYQDFIAARPDERFLLSLPMLLFFREFSREHYLKFTDWGIPFLMEAELLYGESVKEELPLAPQDISEALFLNMTYHLARYFHALTGALTGEVYVGSLAKRVRRFYFCYTWYRYRTYIMNTADLYRFLHKTDLRKQDFFTEQSALYAGDGLLHDLGHFAKGYDYFRKLYLDLCQSRSNSEQPQQQKDRTEPSQLKCPVPDLHVVIFPEWRESWLGVNSGGNRPVIWCYFPDHVQGAEIAKYAGEIARFKLEMTEKFPEHHLLITWERLFREMVTKVHPSTGYFLHHQGFPVTIVPQELENSLKKNISFALYGFPFFYGMNRLMLDREKQPDSVGLVLQIAKTIAVLLALEGHQIVLHPEEALAQMGRLSPAYFACTGEMQQFLIDCLQAGTRLNPNQSCKLLDIFFTTMRQIADAYPVETADCQKLLSYCFNNEQGGV